MSFSFLGSLPSPAFFPLCLQSSFVAHVPTYGFLSSRRKDNFGPKFLPPLFYLPPTTPLSPFYSLASALPQVQLAWNCFSSRFMYLSPWFFCLYHLLPVFFKLFYFPFVPLLPISLSLNTPKQVRPSIASLDPTCSVFSTYPPPPPSFTFLLSLNLSPNHFFFQYQDVAILFTPYTPFKGPFSYAAMSPQSCTSLIANFGAAVTPPKPWSYTLTPAYIFFVLSRPLFCDVTLVSAA